MAIDTQITFRVAPALKAAAEKAAKADSRTLSSWLVKVVTDATAKDKGK
jgi:predicted HicB family RNase H-like nuclease